MIRAAPTARGVRPGLRGSVDDTYFTVQSARRVRVVATTARLAHMTRRTGRADWTGYRFFV